MTNHDETGNSDANALLAQFRVLVVPGLHGSGGDHWQSRWQQCFPAFERVEQEHWDDPQLPVWSQCLQQKLQPQSQSKSQPGLPRDARPVLIVAHSFGCLTTVHNAASGGGPIAAALLVAPADPDKFHVAEAVRTALPFPSVVVASSNDPWMTRARARYWAQQWGSEFIDAGALGHINAESGLGDWHDGQLLLLALAQKVVSRGAMETDHSERIAS